MDSCQEFVAQLKRLNSTENCLRKKSRPIGISKTNCSQYFAKEKNMIQCRHFYFTRIPINAKTPGPTAE